jgi:spore coat polysaccharide biosynthesis predicted glycosyltransferase SpsG
MIVDFGFDLVENMIHMLVNNLFVEKSADLNVKIKDLEFEIVLIDDVKVIVIYLNQHFDLNVNYFLEEFVLFVFCS